MLKSIKIKHCKSIKYSELYFDQINCLIGKNGSGKTNIILALKHFFDRLTDEAKSNILVDRNNPYLDFQMITLEFDFRKYEHIISGAAFFEMFTGSMEDTRFSRLLYQLKKEYMREYVLKLSLNIDKHGNAVWSPNLSKEHRAFIKGLFPMYFISAREINLINWQNVWSILGDVSRFQLNDFEQLFESFFKENYGEVYSELVNKIRGNLSLNELDLKKLSSSEKFAQLLQIQFGGKEFKYKQESLDYFSDGMNSFNFIQLFCRILNDFSRGKLKYPILIIDEPEIGLHPKYIDFLSGVFIKVDGNPQLIISTHSSRIVKNFIRRNSRAELFHISNNSNYTKASKMIQPSDDRQKTRITEKETSCYFSSAIAFIEGATEIEIFTNERILDLFPLLREVDFISGDSVTINTVHPTEKNTNIPYLLIVDMDKILKLNNGKLEIKKEDVNPLYTMTEKQKMEKYYYGEKRVKTYQARKRIESLLGVCQFKTSQSKWFTLEDDYYKLIKGLSKTYCLQHRVYPVDTTIEGSLVNINNYIDFADWLNVSKGRNILDIKFLLEIECDDNVKLTWFRLMIEGKYDTLTKCIDQKEQKELLLIEQEIYKKITKLGKGLDKANGWVESWIEYIFEKHVDTEINQYQKEQKFKMYFGELYDIIKHMEDLVR